MQFSIEKPLIIITGPTAVGKTQLSIDLVKEFNGEIISADSRLFYRGMNIGTAKPTKIELQQVQHHLIDVAEANETWSLALFQREVFRVARDLWKKNKVPFLVGGTGQFIRAIIEGWVIPEKQPDEVLRNILTRWGKKIGSDELHRKLEIIDPKAAEVMEPNNLRRTIRALEVIFSTGKLFSSQRKKQIFGFNYKIVGLLRDRKELYSRVDERIYAMFANGFIDEVKLLLQQGYDPSLPSLSAIGYKEVIQYLEGEMEMQEVIRLMKKRTREYVRRQANWFKKDDPRITWFDMSGHPTKEIKEYLVSPQGWHNG